LLRIDIIFIVAQTIEWNEHALVALRSAGLRSGGARSAVVGFLDQQACCVSAHEIFEGVRPDRGGLGIASVYRVLDTLVEHALVQRVDVGDGITRFEAVQPDGHHHHHLVCDDCGRVQPFDDPSLERELRSAAGRLGYAMSTHEVVLRGACGDCR